MGLHSLETKYESTWGQRWGRLEESGWKTLWGKSRFGKTLQTLGKGTLFLIWCLQSRGTFFPTFSLSEFTFSLDLFISCVASGLRPHCVAFPMV